MDSPALNWPAEERDMAMLEGANMGRHASGELGSYITNFKLPQ